MSNEQELTEKLTRQRPTKTILTDFDFANLQYLLFSFSPIAVVVAAMILAFSGMQEITNLGILIIGGSYGGIVFSGLGFGVYFDWHKKGIGVGKKICKPVLNFMKPNSNEVLLSVQRTLVVADVEDIEARDPVKSLMKLITKDPKVQIVAAKKIVENLTAKLPKAQDGKRYKAVRWIFPDTPIPDPVQVAKDRWEIGGRGTPLSNSMILILHEDFTNPDEVFDLTMKTETLFGHYESETIAHLGIIDIWEFLESTGEYIATAGLTRQHRHTMETVKVDDSAREFIQIVELLRAYQNVAGSEIRIKNLGSALNKALEEGFFEGALGDSLTAASGGWHKKGLGQYISENKFWIFLGVITISLIVIFYLAQAGVFGVG